MPESTVLQDFIAGVEPTGVLTFRHAMQNKKRHGLHQVVGGVGGFVGGALVSPAATALPTMAFGKLLSKKSPILGKALVTTGREMLKMYRPKYWKNVIKHGKGALDVSLRKRDLFQKAENIADKVIKTNEPIQLKSILKIIENLKKEKIVTEKLRQVAKEDPTALAERTMGFIAGGASALMGGGINLLSADLQYRTGRSATKK